MAKVIIKLDLKKPEDLREYNLYNNGDRMFDALSEISRKLKNKVEFLLENTDKDRDEALDLVFEMIAEILEDNNVIIEKLN